MMWVELHRIVPDTLPSDNKVPNTDRVSYTAVSCLHGNFKCRLFNSNYVTNSLARSYCDISCVASFICINPLNSSFLGERGRGCGLNAVC